MPLYTYECKTCNKTSEVMQKMSEDKLEEKECIECGSIQPCRRIITGSNFYLDPNDGWAKTGYDKNIEFLKNAI